MEVVVLKNMYLLKYLKRVKDIELCYVSDFDEKRVKDVGK